MRRINRQIAKAMSLLPGWSFVWIDARERELGACWHASRTIGLNPRCPRSHMLATVAHEIAHALAGANAEHGAEYEARLRPTCALLRVSVRDAAGEYGYV